MTVSNQESSKRRPAPGRLFWILGLAVGIICGTAVAFGVAQVTIAVRDAPAARN